MRNYRSPIGQREKDGETVFTAGSDSKHQAADPRTTFFLSERSVESEVGDWDFARADVFVDRDCDKVEIRVMEPDPEATLWPGEMSDTIVAEVAGMKLFLSTRTAEVLFNALLAKRSTHWQED